MLGWFVQNTVASAALAVLVFVVCLFCRRRPAVQHALWCLVLLKLLTPAWFAWPWSPEKVCARWFPSPQDSAKPTARLAVEDLPPRVNDTSPVPARAVSDESVDTASVEALPKSVEVNEPRRTGLSSRLDGSREPSHGKHEGHKRVAARVDQALPQSSTSAVPTENDWYNWLMLHWRKLLLGIWASGRLRSRFCNSST